MGRKVLPVLTADEVGETVHGALVIAFGEHRAKRAAETANSTVNTAKKWFKGENGVGLTAFLNLARRDPTMRAAAMRLLALEADLDPDFQQELARFVRAAQAVVRR